MQLTHKSLSVMTFLSHQIPSVVLVSTYCLHFIIPVLIFFCLLDHFSFGLAFSVLVFYVIFLKKLKLRSGRIRGYLQLDYNYTNNYFK